MRDTLSILADVAALTLLLAGGYAAWLVTP